MENITILAIVLILLGIVWGIVFYFSLDISKPCQHEFKLKDVMDTSKNPLCTICGMSLSEADTEAEQDDDDENNNLIKTLRK